MDVKLVSRCISCKKLFSVNFCDVYFECGLCFQKRAANKRNKKVEKETSYCTCDGYGETCYACEADVELAKTCTESLQREYVNLDQKCPYDKTGEE